MANRTVTVALKAVTTGFDGPLVASSGKVKELQRSVTKAADSGEKDVGKLSSSTNALGLNLGRLPIAATAVGSALGAAMTYGVGKALEFDKAMRNVQSITKVSDQALGDLGEQVIDLSKDLPQSASTLAEGLYDVASSGFQGADGMKVLKAAAMSASAGMTETAVAAQAITSVLNAYGLEAGQASDVSDQLFQTVNLGVTNFESLAHNIGDYIGQARALNVSFAETQGAIATLTLTGTTQMQAGTALGAVLNQLIRPQQGLADAIEKTGYASGTALIQAKGFRGALMLLAQQTGGSAEKMGELFTDSQALRAALQLTGNQGKKWAEIAGQIEDPVKRAGAAQKALAEQSKSVSFQLAVAKNKVDAAAISFASNLLPVIARSTAVAVEFGQHTAQALTPLTPLVEILWKALGNVVDIGGDLVHIFGPVGEQFAMLAATPLVLVMYGLAKALEAVTGFLADNQFLAAALAIAYGIHLAGGIAAVALMLGTNLKVALAVTRVGMTGATASTRAFTSSLLGLASAEAVATAGIVAVAASLLVNLHAMSQGASEARDQVKGLFADLQLGDDTTFVALAHHVSDLADKADRAASSGNWLQRRWHELNGTAMESASAASAFRDELDHLADSEEDALWNVSRLRAALGFTTEEILRLAKAAGVDLSGDLDDVTHKLVEYYNINVAAAPGTTKLSAAMDTLSDAAASADDKIKSLSDALDELVGVNIDAMKAEDNLAASIAAVGKALHDNGRSFDVNSEKGRANRQAIESAGDAVIKHIEALARQGTTLDKLQPIYARDIAKLRATATQAGLTKSQFEKLLRQMGLTPDLVRTIVDQVGAEGVVRDLKNVATAGKNAAKPIRIPVFVTGLDKFIYDLTHLPKPTVTVTVEGLITGGIPYPKNAAGGLLTGAGTGISDSNVTRYSNGEFMVNAFDTAQNLDLLQAINNGAFRSAPAVVVNSAAGGGSNFTVGDIRLNGPVDSRAGESVVMAWRDEAFKRGYR